MGKILPILLILLGVGGGGAAGLMLRPEATPEQAADAKPDGSGATHEISCPETAGHTEAEKPNRDYDVADSEFVKLSNQFVVPVLADDEIDAMVVLSISLEVSTGTRETIFQREPKLRDGFLQVLFDHSNSGGFEGNYISSAALDDLRRALTENARKIGGSAVRDVLIVEFVKQSV